jgi:hypothetical protein
MAGALPRTFHDCLPRRRSPSFYERPDDFVGHLDTSLQHPFCGGNASSECFFEITTSNAEHTLTNGIALVLFLIVYQSLSCRKLKLWTDQ